MAADGAASGVTDRDHVGGVLLPTITDEFMRVSSAKARAFTGVILRKTDKCVLPDVMPIIWEHGRRNYALREHGVMALVLPANDDPTDVAGFCVFTVSPDEVRHIMDHDPGVSSGIFTYEVHPVRGFPGDGLPAAT